MSQTVTLKQSDYQKLVNRIVRLEREVSRLLQIYEKEPSYGSDEWWEWSDAKALEDIQRGDYYQLNTTQEIEDFFKNIEKNKSNEKYHRSVLQKRLKSN